MIVHMDGVDVSHPMAKRLAAAALAHHSEQLPHAMAAREAARQEMAAERRVLFRDHRVRMAANSSMPAEHEEQPARELGRTKNKIIWRQRAAEQARKNELQRVRNRAHYFGVTLVKAAAERRELQAEEDYSHAAAEYLGKQAAAEVRYSRQQAAVRETAARLGTDRIDKARAFEEEEGEKREHARRRSLEEMEAAAARRRAIVPQPGSTDRDVLGHKLTRELHDAQERRWTLEEMEDKQKAAAMRRHAHLDAIIAHAATDAEIKVQQAKDRRAIAAIQAEE